MDTETLPAPPRQTANPAPVRGADSVRRTSSIDVSWPDGPEGDRLFIGRVRDYQTPAEGSPGTLHGEAELRATLNEEKEIVTISADPTPDHLEKMLGERAGGHLRVVLRDLMPQLLESGEPLYLALDDLSGTALVSAFAWSQWHPDWAERIRSNFTPEEFDKMMESRTNVCWGLKEGNSGVKPGGLPNAKAVANAEAGDLRNPEDPHGWHDLPEADGPGFRRARRIDVTRDAKDGMLLIDSAFQDSARKKEGGRVAIHEYNLKAAVRPDTLEILTLEPEARILPFWECPGAINNTQRLVGSSIADIRYEVINNLRGPEGCTHLNDALRALAEVPKLAGYL